MRLPLPITAPTFPGNQRDYAYCFSKLLMLLRILQIVSAEILYHIRKTNSKFSILICWLFTNAQRAMTQEAIM